MMSRYFSPYQLNPLNQNPLRNVLAKVVDFDVLRRAKNVRMFTSATNVRSGRIKVFPCSEATVDTVLASACIPLMFQAVEIDGEHYWDGGYMGNPPIYPLIYHCDSRDVVLVMINPIVIDDVPTDARAIVDRINTLSFNSSLMREMRAINFVSKLIDAASTMLAAQGECCCTASTPRMRCESSTSRASSTRPGTSSRSCTSSADSAPRPF